jgi:multidrug efflux pump subunit AcrB
MPIRPTEHRSKGTHEYVKALRRELPRRFPNLAFHFEAADTVSQILNFGVAAPIDVQISGFNTAATYAAAQSVAAKMRQIPGAVHVRIHQVTNAPRLHLTVDQTRVAELGLTQRDVANTVLVATANSILMVTFANDRRHENGDTAVEAALAAGRTRLQPVIMTALASPAQRRRPPSASATPSSAASRRSSRTRRWSRRSTAWSRSGTSSSGRS